jgi:hypothetical protein
MRKLLPLFGLLFFLVACDSMTVVSRTPTGAIRQETHNVSCTYSGLCQACETNFSSGKTKCYLGFHQSCSGNRDARVNLQDFTVRYKDGHVDTETQTTTDHYLTECK